jgi:hypothetical protein
MFIYWADSWLIRRQLWLSSVCFDYNLGHEQAVCKMGAQNVDGRPEACQIWKLQGHFWLISRLIKQISSGDLWPRMRPVFTSLNQNPSY